MKRLRNILAISAAAVMASSALVGCDKWTEPEALDFDRTMEGTYHGDAYYKNLRAYKASKHTLCFGWFSGWTGVGKPDTRLMGMPDSIDIVSLWSGWTDLSEEQIQDLRDVQTIKGTRVIPCLIIDNIGKGVTPTEVSDDFIVDGVQYNSYEEAMSAYWGWYSIQQSSGGWPFPTTTEAHYVDGVKQDSAPENIQEIIEAAVRKYGKAICDEVNRYGYDGFDIDFEPTSYPGNISRQGAYNPRLYTLIDEMSKYLGPQSGTGKILAVDGEPYSLSAECGPKLTYFIIQAYNDSTDTNIDTSTYRIGGLLRLYADVHTRDEIVGKTFLTSDFESGAANGGIPSVYTTRNGEKTKQIYGFAQYYDAETGTRIGGFGAFRFQFDYTNGNNYDYMRTAIQLANPAVK